MQLDELTYNEKIDYLKLVIGELNNVDLNKKLEQSFLKIVNRLSIILCSRKLTNNELNGFISCLLTIKENSIQMIKAR
ncbi:MAG: hypothetical protein MR227_05350 [Firmicutes bacterium]|nr:hypothetical protein [Bacillota bacterium]